MGSSSSKPSPRIPSPRPSRSSDYWLSKPSDDWLRSMITDDLLSRHSDNCQTRPQRSDFLYQSQYGHHHNAFFSPSRSSSSSSINSNVLSIPVSQPLVTVTPSAITNVNNTIPPTSIPTPTLAATPTVSSKSPPDKPISQCSRGSQICMQFLRGACSYGLDCRFLHSDVPYLWAYWSQSNKTWYKFVDQALLEKSYCDPALDTCQVTINQSSSSFSLDITFNDNTKDPFSAQNFEIRRFCTRSIGQCNDDMATQWLWYCQIEDGFSTIWKMYSQDDDCSLSSIEFEKAFVNSEKELIFTIGNVVYYVAFDSLAQINIETQFSRRIRRRPKYLSISDIQELKKKPRQNYRRAKTGRSTNNNRQPSNDDGPTNSNRQPNNGDRPTNNNRQPRNGNGSTNMIPFRGCPRHWATSGEDKENYLHPVLCKFTNWEFRRVVNAMRLSMPRVFVKALYRIENKKLHELFVLKRRQMVQELTEESLNEQFLFHGCPAATIDAICHQGFDFRLSGERVGAIWGKGVYFALEASYSNDYSEQSCHRHKKMFIAKVLVGRYTLGSANYKRPPAINNSHVLYDSCVNDESNPTIFAIFDSSQVYPEYLVEYRYM